MTTQPVVSGFLAAFCLALVGAPADCQSTQRFVMQAGVYDPGNTGSPSSTWININSRIALHMTMSEPVAYPPGAAAGASIFGPGLVPLSRYAPNLTLSQIGFDLTKDSQNGGGAPRFNLYDNNGNYWLMTCLAMQQSGTTTPVVRGGQTLSNWVHISCNPANVPILSSGAHPGLPFTNSTIVTRIDIIFDYPLTPGAYTNMAQVSFNDGQPCRSYFSRP